MHPLRAVVEFIHRIASDKAYTDMTDSGLVKRFFTEKDEKAFITLLKRHGPMVLRVGRHILGHDQDVEDIFQAAFLLLARKAKSIRKHQSVASWLYGVAQRLALNMKRRGINRQAQERQAAVMGNKAKVSDKACQELQTALHEALAQLPEKYRAALLECYLEGKTQEEAARHLGCPLGTVRSRLARGRVCLQKLLEQRGLPLSATAVVTALAANSASAAVAPTLVRADGQSGPCICIGSGGYGSCLGESCRPSSNWTQNDDDSQAEDHSGSFLANRRSDVCCRRMGRSQPIGGVDRRRQRSGYKSKDTTASLQSRAGRPKTARASKQPNSFGASA